MRGRKRQSNRKSLGGVVELPIHGNNRKCPSLHFQDRGPNAIKTASGPYAESDPLETLSHCIKLNQVNNLTECAIALSDLKFKGLSVFIDQPFVRADWHLGSRSLCVETPKEYKHFKTKSLCEDYDNKRVSYKKRKQNQVSASDESKKFKFLAPSGIYVDVATAPRSRPDLRHGAASVKETKSSDLLSSASSDVFSTGRNPQAVTAKSKYISDKTGPGRDEDLVTVDMGGLYVEGQKSMSPAPNESKCTTIDLDATAGNSNAFDLHRRPQEPELDDDILDDYAIARILSERFGSEKRYPEKMAGVSATVVEDLQLGRTLLEKSPEEQESLMGRKMVLDLNSPTPVIKNAPVFSNPESNLSQMTRLPSPIPYQSCSTPDSVSGPTDGYKLEKLNEAPFSLSDERDEVSEAEFPNPGETKMAMSVTNASTPDSLIPGCIRNRVHSVESSTSNQSPSIEDEQPESLNILDSIPLVRNAIVPTPSAPTVGYEADKLESRATELKSGGTLKSVVDLNKEDSSDFCSRSSIVFFRQNRPKFDPKTFQSLSTVKSTSGVYVYKRNKCSEDNVKSIFLSENDAAVNSVPC